MDDPRVTVLSRRGTEERRETESLESWLADVLRGDGYIEGRLHATRTLLLGLLVGLVKKGVLTVADVIELTGEFNVVPAEEVPA